MNQFLLYACWFVAIVYATVPSYWLIVHPFVGWWRARRARLSAVGPIWFLLWVIAALATRRLLHLFLYTTAFAWIPGGLLVLAAILLYSQARRDFSTDQVLGRSELEPDKHEQRLVTTGIRGRVRHPYYLAHTCNLLGITIGTGSAALYALALFGALTGVVMVRVEERELEQRFGAAYREYKKKVPLLF
jgi:protein-S-isoprenylcysteine O-methyltransferase Ste14